MFNNDNDILNIDKDYISVIISFKFFNVNSGNGSDLELIQTLNFLNFDIRKNSQYGNKYLKILNSICNYDSECYKECKYVETPIISLLLQQENTTNMFYFFIKEIITLKRYNELQSILNCINTIKIKQFFEKVKFDINNFILENMYSKEEYDNIELIVRIVLFSF